MATYDDILPPASPFQRVTTPPISGSPFRRETGGLDDIFTDDIPDTGQAPAGAGRQFRNRTYERTPQISADPTAPVLSSVEDIDRIQSPRTKFFRMIEKDPGLPSTVKDDIINAALRDDVNLSKIRGQIDATRRAKRLGDIRIQHDELRLSEARRKAHEARTEPVVAGRIGSEMQAIMGATGATDLQIRNALAALRMRNSTLFTKSDSLRDMYATGMSTLNVPKPVTEADLRARRAEARSIQEDREEDRREPIETDLANLESDYARIRSAKPRTKMAFADGASSQVPTGEFLTTNDKGAAESFVGKYLPGEDVATKYGEIMKQVDRAFEKERESLQSQIFGSGRPGSLGHLNLPSR